MMDILWNLYLWLLCYHCFHWHLDTPLTWKTGNLDVFTGTGIERFQQEVQSANHMMEQLGATQDAIAKQAYNTNLFPPEAFRFAPGKQ